MPLLTAIAIAAVAYTAGDLVHEALGHGVACLLAPECTPLSLSTVALQTSTSNAAVAAAGPMANLLAGLVALGCTRFVRRFTPAAFFAWLFAASNLLNVAGYLVFSGVTNTGDFSVVIRDSSSPFAWRIAMAATGAAGYVFALKAIGGTLARWTREHGLDTHHVAHAVRAAYVVGGIVLVAGAALNPIHPSLILTAGAGVGFGNMLGLLYVPVIVRKQSGDREGGVLPASRTWVAAGVTATVLFVGVFGPGISFQR